MLFHIFFYKYWFHSKAVYFFEQLQLHLMNKKDCLWVLGSVYIQLKKAKTKRVLKKVSLAN